MKRQQGFTLIELIVVIVILGILAATALPRFSGLSTDARVAKMNGLLGSLKAGTAMAHGSSLARQLGAASDVVLEDGTSVSMVLFYPAANSGITNVVDVGDYITVASGTNAVTFYPDQARADLTNCALTYTEADSSVTPTAPTFTTSGVDITGCV